MGRESGRIGGVSTRYAGRLFRSRLEARWAAFFDLAGVEWEYEPEDDRPKGWWPDFLVVNGGKRVLVEVKPVPFSPVSIDPAYDKALSEKWSLLLGDGPDSGYVGFLARLARGAVETVCVTYDSENGLHSVPLGVNVPKSAAPQRLWDEALHRIPSPGVSAAINRVIEAQMGKKMFHFNAPMPPLKKGNAG